MVNDTSRQQQSNASLHTLWHTIKCSNHWKYKFRWGKNLHSLEKGSGFSKTLFSTLHTLVVFVCDYYGLKMVENWKPWINWIHNARDSRRIWHICEESFYVICHLFDSMIKRTWIWTFIDKMHAILFSFFFFQWFWFWTISNSCRIIMMIILCHSNFFQALPLQLDTFHCGH